MASSNSTPSSRRDCFCALASLIYIFCCLIYSMAWILVAITADKPGVQVDSASLDSFTLSNTTKLTAEWSIKLSPLNTNHHLRVLYCDTYHGKLFYRDQQGRPYDDVILNTSTLQSFFNGSMRLKVDTYVGSYVAEGIDLSRRKHGMVEFGLTLSTWIIFKSDFFVFPHSKSFVVCYPLRFEISQNFYNTTPGILLQGVTCT